MRACKCPHNLQYRIDGGDDDDDAGESEQEIGEGRVYSFPESHLGSGELVETATETDLAQWFGVA